MGRWEWIIVELLALGALIYELMSIRRSIAKDRLAEAEKQKPEG